MLRIRMQLSCELDHAPGSLRHTYVSRDSSIYDVQLINSADLLAPLGFWVYQTATVRVWKQLSEMRAEDAGRRIILAYLALLVTAGCCIPTASGLVSFRTAAPYLELIGTPCILIVSFTIKDFHARTKHDRNLQCWEFRSEVRLECKNSWTNVGVYYTYITQHTFYSIYFMMLFTNTA